MPTYKSKPTTCEAMEWDGSNSIDLELWMDSPIKTVVDGALTFWVTKSNEFIAIDPGDFIIKEPDGTGFYPCKRDIFHMRWESSAT